MRHIPALTRRELSAYFLSPIAYFILLGFQLVAGFNFFRLVQYLTDYRNDFSSINEPMNSYIAGSLEFWLALLVAIPALTMRLIAEEKRSGTIETLLTVPVTETEVVLAKWLAGLVMFAVLMLPFALYLPFLHRFYPFETGPFVALGLGVSTLGMMFVAIGLFFSSLTRHQIVAAISTFVTLFMIVMLSYFVYQVAVDVRSTYTDAIRFVSVVIQTHLFGSGRLDLRFMAMHVSVAALMLYLTVKVLESRPGK